METLFAQPGIFLIVILAWNIALTGVFFRLLKHYRNLSKGAGEGNLEKILEDNLKQVKINKAELDKLSRFLSALSLASKTHFQKVGLVKFNPFAEMGGNQSFSLALLDGNNSGVVITSLHSRELTRLYVKLVKESEVVEGKFSKEEKLAVNQCLKQKGAR